MNNKLYIGIIAVLAIAVAWLGYKVTTQQKEIVYVKQEYQNLDEERQNLAIELENMKMQYDTLQTDNAQMRSDIESQKLEIENLLSKVKNKNYEITKLKKETETLRTIMKGYIYTIDSLNVANARLTKEKTEALVRAENAEQTSKTLQKDLSQSKEELQKASVLQTSDYRNTGVDLRSSGKQVDTDRAARCEMIKSCFTLRKNLNAKAGNKEIFLTIIGPDGKVLPNKEGQATIKVSGQEQNYSVMREVDYQKEDLDVCVYYSVQGELTKGAYKIYVYEGGNMIGQTDLVLK